MPGLIVACYAVGSLFFTKVRLKGGGSEGEGRWEEKAEKEKRKRKGRRIKRIVHNTLAQILKLNFLLISQPLLDSSNSMH